MDVLPGKTYARSVIDRAPLEKTGSGAPSPPRVAARGLLFPRVMNTTRTPARRVTRSFLDPLIAPAVPRLYGWLRIPRRVPPEAVVATGHVIALAGAVGFAASASHPFGGWLAAACVAGNHLADVVDGTHARRTGQCRNGGELLDHFTDPLSFSYWIAGIGYACGRVDLALVGVIAIYATALLTNIRAKIVGEFRLSSVGPTEFKALLVLAGIGGSAWTTFEPFGVEAERALAVFLGAIAIVACVSVGVQLVRSVREVNACGPRPDSMEWVVAGAAVETGPGRRASNRGGPRSSHSPNSGDADENLADSDGPPGPP